MKSRLVITECAGYIILAVVFLFKYTITSFLSTRHVYCIVANSKF